MRHDNQASDAELERELRRLEAEANAADTDEARQRANSRLSEVRWELMKRGQMTLGGGCAQ